jgi:hypothetical protein
MLMFEFLDHFLQGIYFKRIDPRPRAGAPLNYVKNGGQVVSKLQERLAERLVRQDHVWPIASEQERAQIVYSTLYQGVLQSLGDFQSVE